MTEANKQHTVAGPILALDLGEKRVGMAVSDELLISVTRLAPITRSNWKELLREVAGLVAVYSAKALVIGFPLSLRGTKGSAALAVERVAEKFARSLPIPIYLQDERLTSVAAAEQLRAQGYSLIEVRERIDSEAAAIILSDFRDEGQRRILVAPAKSNQ